MLVPNLITFPPAFCSELGGGARVQYCCQNIHRSELLIHTRSQSCANLDVMVVLTGTALSKSREGLALLVVRAGLPLLLAGTSDGLACSSSSSSSSSFSLSFSSYNTSA